MTDALAAVFIAFFVAALLCGGWLAFHCPAGGAHRWRQHRSPLGGVYWATCEKCGERRDEVTG